MRPNTAAPLLRQSSPAPDLHQGFGGQAGSTDTGRRVAMATPAAGPDSGHGRLEQTRLGTLRDEIGDQRLSGFVKAFLLLLDERLDRIADGRPGHTSDALRAERDLRVS